jgi:hypothetical protein
LSIPIRTTNLKAVSPKLKGEKLWALFVTKKKESKRKAQSEDTSKHYRAIRD